MVQIVKCSTKIITVIGSVKAIITGVCIREDCSVSYEISYFHNGINTTAWVRRYEFEIDVQEKQKAGFVHYEEKPSDDQHTSILMLDSGKKEN